MVMVHFLGIYQGHLPINDCAWNWSLFIAPSATTLIWFSDHVHAVVIVKLADTEKSVGSFYDSDAKRERKIFRDLNLRPSEY